MVFSWQRCILFDLVNTLLLIDVKVASNKIKELFDKLKYFSNISFNAYNLLLSNSLLILNLVSLLNLKLTNNIIIS